MLRLSLVGFGRLMLLGSVVCCFMAISAVSSGNADHGLAAARVHDNIVTSALMAAGWAACLIAAFALSLYARLERPPADPYEDHPKMSPSVQPTYVSYSKVGGS